MFRAITVIELLATLAVMVISLSFFSPVLFRLQETILLDNEVDQIKSFIYQIREKSSYQNQDYIISISQNLTDKKWCIVALQNKAKNSPRCNCLEIKSCSLTDEYFVYFSSKITLSSKELYPNDFLNINAKRANLPDRCLTLSLNNHYRKLQINSIGVINVAKNNKRTKC